MLNQVVCVGRLFEKPREVEEENKWYYELNLRVRRPYKNKNGEYGEDILHCVLDLSFGDKIKYLNKNDVVGIKGRLETDCGLMEIVVEKITMLQAKEKEECENA